MQIKPIEVFSYDPSLSIVRMPGRRFPGCVIQGDSLSILLGLVETIKMMTAEQAEKDEDLFYEIKELHESLLARVEHYEQVLEQYGIQLPYQR
jgi:hypothetical protein